MEENGTWVLGAEDNHEVGTFAAQTRRELGYGPVRATEAKRAISVSERIPFRFEVALSDLTIHGMNGIEAAAEIRRRCPGKAVVLASDEGRGRTRRADC